MRHVLPKVSGKECLVPLVLCGLLCLSSVRGAGQELADGSALLELKPGTQVVRELSRAGAQTFEVRLDGGQYLHFTIEKGDLNLALAVNDPRGQKIFERTSREYEPVEVSLVAAVAGTYQVAVRSLEQEGQGSRSFKLTVGQTGQATKRDLQDGAASGLFAEASQLRAVWEEAALRKAVDNYLKAWRAWHSSAHWHNAAAALTEAAEVHFVLGEYRQALSLYQRASAESRRAGDQQAEMAASGHAGRLHSNLGNNDEAQRQLRRVLGYFEQRVQADSSPDVRRDYAAALGHMGEVFYAQGSLVRAGDYLQNSLNLSKEVGDRRQEARAALFAGFVTASSGEQEKALSHFQRALELSRALADRHSEMLALNATGSLRAIRGDAQAAADVHHETLGVFRAIGDRQSEAVTLLGIGQDFDFLNERPTALDYYEQALSLALSDGSLDFASVVLYQLAAFHRAAGESDKALTYYGRCVRLSRAVGKTRMAAYALNDTAAIYAERGKGDQTLRQYRAALRLFAAIGDRLGQAVTLNSMGDFFSALKDRRRALDFYRQARPFSRESGDRELEVSTLYKLAGAARDSGELESAVSYIRESIEAIELLRSYVATPDLRSSYFASVHQHYELYIDLLMRLERQRPGEGFAATALQVCERARARSLVEILAEAGADPRRAGTPAQLERERTLRDMLRVKARQQLELANNHPEQNELDEIAREVRRLTAEYQLLQAQLREQDPRYAALAPSDPLSVTEIQAKLLDRETVLLEYSLGDERSYLWAVTADSFSSYELPGRAALEGAAREVYDLLTARVPPGGGIDAGYQGRVEAADRQYPEKARRLSRMLLEPVAALLGHKRLLIISEGILQYIPFDALPTPSTGPGDSPVPDDPLPMVSSHEVVTLPSISTLVALRREAARVGPTDKIVAVLADPVFTADDARVKKAVGLRAGASPHGAEPGPAQPAVRDFYQLTGGGTARRLKETSREAGLIVAAAPEGTGMMATDFAANREAALNAQLRPYRIVHFATHSLVNSEHPELSGILLSQVNEAGEGRDGFLQLSDIYSMNLSADLVVLSACNTGLGKNVRGEGLVGLTRGFMYAGSKSVVASLWKVDDQATAELMGLFYDGMLRKGLRPAAALREAKEALRRQKSWRSPYFWAAFVIQGEYRDPIPVGDRAEPATRLVLPAAAVLILACAYAFLRRRRRLHLR